MRALMVLGAGPLVACSAVLGLDDPTPGASCAPSCDGDALVTCDGNEAKRTPCELGCAAAPAPHCQAIVPSNEVTLGELDGVDRVLQVAAGTEYVLRTDDGSIVYWSDEMRNEVRPASPSGGVVEGMRFTRLRDTVGVLSVAGLVIEPGGKIEVVGRRALVLLSRGDVVIGGDLDLSAGCNIDGNYTTRCGGPGAGHGATAGEAAGGCGPGDDGAAADESVPSAAGGGGGGFGSAGATGANKLFQSEGGGDGGGACGTDWLEPLIGGSGGGAAAEGAGGEGGGGGGAVQIVSLTRIAIDSGSEYVASIYAAGAGGRALTEESPGGGGGGSGGAILLEAPLVFIAQGNILSANGGGGGSGTVGGSPGDYGSRGPDRADGGDGTGDDRTQGRGGLGASLDGVATEGVAGLGGGGGGGGVGRIRVHARTFTFDGAVITPEHTEGALRIE